MLFPLSVAIEGGVEENSEDLVLKRLLVNWSRDILTAGGLMCCGIRDLRGFGDGIEPPEQLIPKELVQQLGELIQMIAPPELRQGQESLNPCSSK
ncbi:hypothetical protein Tco_1521287 [Tanacetum coccineum]